MYCVMFVSPRESQILKSRPFDDEVFILSSQDGQTVCCLQDCLKSYNEALTQQRNWKAKTCFRFVINITDTTTNKNNKE